MAARFSLMKWSPLPAQRISQIVINARSGRIIAPRGRPDVVNGKIKNTPRDGNETCRIPAPAIYRAKERRRHRPVYTRTLDGPERHSIRRAAPLISRPARAHTHIAFGDIKVDYVPINPKINLGCSPAKLSLSRAL